MRALLFLLLLIPFLLTGEEKAAPAGDAPKKRRLTAAELREFYSNPAGRILTEWSEIDRDTKTWQAFTKAGYSTVLSEGKMDDGQMVFRKGFKHLSDVYPDAESPMWCTYTGMRQRSFADRNRALLKDGYTLMRMQRFVHDDGEFRFCAIWVRFLPAPPKK